MNTLILLPDQFIDSKTALLTERQLSHVNSVLKLSPGDILKTGKLNGNLGSGVFDLKDGKAIVRDMVLAQPAPATLPLTLILALPRPQMLKRILQTVACFGVEKLVLIQSNRVEKSFWQSPSAQAYAIEEHLILGLEQANATQIPEVQTFKQFKMFIEDVCPELTSNTDRYLLHPGPYPFMPCEPLTRPTTIAIGPEGGFTEYETGRWLEQGFHAVQLGQRVLRVETAVTTALARCIG